MRHQPPTNTALALLAAVATTLPACSSAQHAGKLSGDPESTHAQQRELESGVLLTTDQIAQLFATEEGRQTLQALADQQPHIYFDGRNRFVQVGNTISFAYGRLPSLSLHNGWMHPDYAVSSSIMLLGTPLDAPLNIEFTPNAMLVHIGPPADNAEPYAIPWSQHKKTPWATIDHQTHAIAYQP